MAKSVDQYKYERMLRIFLELSENQQLARETILENIYDYQKPSKQALDDDDELRKRHQNILRMFQRDIKDLNGIFERIQLQKQITHAKGDYWLVDQLENRADILKMSHKLILMELLADSKLLSLDEFNYISEIIMNLNSANNANKRIYQEVKRQLSDTYQEGINPYSFESKKEIQFVQSISDKIGILYPAAYLEYSGKRMKGLNEKLKILKLIYRDRKYQEKPFKVIVNAISFNNHHMYVNVTLLDKELQPLKHNSERSLRIDRIVEVQETNDTYLNSHQAKKAKSNNGFNGRDKIKFECRGDAILPAIDQYIDMYQENNPTKQIRDSGNKNRVEFSYAGLKKEDAFEVQLQKAIEKEDGKATFEIYDSIFGVKIWLLSQGANVKAISPPSLVEAMKKDLQKALNRYE